LCKSKLQSLYTWILSYSNWRINVQIV
jgi:hypothetical protein